MGKSSVRLGGERDQRPFSLRHSRSGMRRARASARIQSKCLGVWIAYCTSDGQVRVVSSDTRRY